MVRTDPYLLSHACAYYKHPEVYVNTRCIDFCKAVSKAKQSTALSDWPSRLNTPVLEVVGLGLALRPDLTLITHEVVRMFPLHILLNIHYCQIYKKADHTVHLALQY